MYEVICIANLGGCTLPTKVVIKLLGLKFAMEYNITNYDVFHTNK